jgi:hypothetical protein
MSSFRAADFKTAPTRCAFDQHLADVARFNTSDGRLCDALVAWLRA